MAIGSFNEADDLKCPKCENWSLKPTTEIVDPHGRVVVKCINCADVFLPCSEELAGWLKRFPTGEF